MFKPTILIIVAALAVLIILSSVTLGDPGPTPVAGTPKTLDKIPLVQSVRLHLQPTGKAHNLTLPSNLGFAVTEISTSARIGVFDKPLTVSVNGLTVCKRVIGIIGNYDFDTASFTPPILVPPGGTLTLTSSFPNDMDLEVGGYLLTLADLGL